MPRIFAHFVLTPVGADLDAWLAADPTSHEVPLRYPGFEDENELMPEFVLVPAVRADVAEIRPMPLPAAEAGRLSHRAASAPRRAGRPPRR